MADTANPADDYLKLISRPVHLIYLYISAVKILTYACIS